MIADPNRFKSPLARDFLVRKRIAFLLLPLCCCVGPLAPWGFALDLDLDPRTGLPHQPPRLAITRFPNSTSVGSQTLLRENAAGRFQPYFRIESHLDDADFCQSLLEGFQLFPLNVMLENFYISPEQYNSLRRVEVLMRASQFTAVDLLTVDEGAAIEGKDYDVRKGIISPLFIAFQRQNRILRTAGTLWSVAGQETTSHSRIVVLPMPWQLDPEFSHVRVDRSEIRMAYELGRSAGQFGPLVRAQVLFMVNDVLVRGESLDHAYVFAHALAPAQARLFLSFKHPETQERIFKPFASHGDGNRNVVLIAKLRDLAALAELESFSELLHGVIAASGQRIGWEAALDLVHSVESHMRLDLDFVHPWAPERKSPIIVRNTSQLVGWFMAVRAQHHGIYNQGGPEVGQYLSSNRWLEHDFRGPHIADPLIPRGQEFMGEQFVAIANLDPEIAKAHPDYTKIVLLGVYQYFDTQISIFRGRGVPEHILHQLQAELAKVRFVINSSRDPIILQASEIPGAETRQFQTIEIVSRLRANEAGIHIQPNHLSYEVPGFIFTLESIRKLMAREPHLAAQARHAIRLGNHQTLQRLNFYP